MKWLNKHYIGISTGIALILTVLTIILRNSFTQLQIATVFLTLLLAMHFWEENVIPGGFHEMTLDQLKISHGTLEVAGTFQFLVVFIPAALTLTLPKIAWLAMILPVLGVLEAIVHTAMIKIFRQKKPYSPGMVTAYIMCVLSIWMFGYAAKNSLVEGWQYAAAVFIMVIGFLCGQQWMLRHAGMKLPDMTRRMKKFMKTGLPE